MLLHTAAIWSQITMLIASKRSRTARQKAKSDLLQLSRVLGNCRGEDLPRGEDTGDAIPLYVMVWSPEPEIKDHRIGQRRVKTPSQERKVRSAEILEVVPLSYTTFSRLLNLSIAHVHRPLIIQQ